MNNRGLNEDVIKKINDTFALFPEAEEVILYGSRARGNYKPDSDIDLILKGESLNKDILENLSGKIDDLHLPYIVELYLYQNINNPLLLEQVNKIGVLFYSKKVPL